MKIKILSIMLMLACFVSLVSCMNDDTEVVSYDEAALASFSLGTLQRTYDTKTAAGKDTTVTVSYTGTQYPFYIDQINGTVWNVDSLPCGTHIDKALCNMAAVNGGMICLLNQTRDSVNVWQSTDSVDLSYDRGLRVFSNSGKYMRDYNIHVNVSKVAKRATEWYAMPAAEQIGGLLAGMRAIRVGDEMVVYGSDGEKTAAYSTADGKTWNSAGIYADADAWKNIVGADGVAYMLNADGMLLRSEVVGVFETVADMAETGVVQLAGGSKSQLFGLTADGNIMLSTDNGNTWKPDTLLDDKDASLLPDANICMVTMKHKINTDMTMDFMIGTSKNEENTAVVWRKIEGEPERFAGWDCINVGNDNKKARLPKLDDMCVVNTDKGYLVAIGGVNDGDAKTMKKAIWVSMDQGLTWFSETYLQMPDDLDASATSWTALTDKDNTLWFFFGKTGQVWKVKINAI